MLEMLGLTICVCSNIDVCESIN